MQPSGVIFESTHIYFLMSFYFIVSFVDFYFLYFFKNNVHELLEPCCVVSGNLKPSWSFHFFLDGLFHLVYIDRVVRVPDPKMIQTAR